MGMVRQLGIQAFVFALVLQFTPTEGQNVLIVPTPRNAEDDGPSSHNGLNAGGKDAVHGDGYRHGICGNAKTDTDQNWNRARDVQATYFPDSTENFTVRITEHQFGYFEFDLCLDASKLSEDCFKDHRLLKRDCLCTCTEQQKNNCPECNRCRRWWKPLTQDEVSSLASEVPPLIYEGPVLTDSGETEFSMRYVIPDLQSTRAVLRWHYVTNVAQGESKPEEFWNCADVAIMDSDPVTPLPDAIAVNSQTNIALAALPAIDVSAIEGVFVPPGTEDAFADAEEYDRTFLYCPDWESASEGVTVRQQCEVVADRCRVKSCSGCLTNNVCYSKTNGPNYCKQQRNAIWCGVDRFHARPPSHNHGQSPKSERQQKKCQDAYCGGCLLLNGYPNGLCNDNVAEAKCHKIDSRAIWCPDHGFTAPPAASACVVHTENANTLEQAVTNDDCASCGLGKRLWPCQNLFTAKKALCKGDCKPGCYKNPDNDAADDERCADCDVQSYAKANPDLCSQAGNNPQCSGACIPKPGCFQNPWAWRVSDYPDCAECPNQQLNRWQNCNSWMKPCKGECKYTPGTGNRRLGAACKGGKGDDCPSGGSR